jgi:hypothetical protein
MPPKLGCTCSGENLRDSFFLSGESRIICNILRKEPTQVMLQTHARNATRMFRASVGQSMPELGSFPMHLGAESWSRWQTDAADTTSG